MIAPRYSKILGKRLKINPRTQVGKLQYLTLNGKIKEWIDADLLREYITEIFEFEERSKNLRKNKKDASELEEEDYESRRRKKRVRKRHWSSSMSVSPFGKESDFTKTQTENSSVTSNLKNTVSRWGVKDRFESSSNSQQKFQLNLGRNMENNPFRTTERERSRNKRENSRRRNRRRRGRRSYSDDESDTSQDSSSDGSESEDSDESYD